MATTTTERLQKVRDAIDARIDGGAVSAYTVDGTNVQKASLAELMALEKKLESQAFSESKGRGRSYARFTEPE